MLLPGTNYKNNNPWSGAADATVEHAAFDKHTDRGGHHGNEEDGEAVEPSVDVLFLAPEHLADGLAGESFRSVEHAYIDCKAFQRLRKSEKVGGNAARTGYGNTHATIAKLLVEGTGKDAYVGFRS